MGSSKFRPSDGQRLRVMLEYDSVTNKLSGVATNLDTGETATFSLDLGNYFTPPQPGTYVFGVGSWTGFDLKRPRYVFTTWMYIGMGRRTGLAPELPAALRAARALHVRP
ncbi:MAG: hypothetical protein AT715_09580 [Thermoproteus sp. JCHS_4]|nr:MAG: hypothetical protein AT715_09580 [Thermoproteus sp. JCHS_4]